MSSQMVGRFGAVAAGGGGAFWVVKGAAILLTGVQPPLLFETAPILFALALAGLHARTGAAVGRSRTIGLVLAALSGAMAIGGLIATQPDSSGESFSPLIFGSFITLLGALILLGLCARRTKALRRSLQLLPLGMGVSMFPLIAVGGALESINERLLEVPLVLLGLTWMWLGYLLWFPESRAEFHDGTA